MFTNFSMQLIVLHVCITLQKTRLRSSTKINIFNKVKKISIQNFKDFRTVYFSNTACILIIVFII